MLDGMSEQRRFIRFYVDGEIEVIDEVQTHVFLNNFGTDEHGNVGMVSFPENDVMTPQTMALQQFLGEAVTANRDRLGFKMCGVSVYARPVVDGQHPEVTLPKMLAKQADEGGACHS